MDSLKPRKKIISAGDGMVPHKNNKPVVESKPVSTRVIGRNDIPITETRHNQPSPPQFRRTVSHSLVWKRVSVVIMSSLISLCSIGFLYSRAVLEIVPESHHVKFPRTFTVANRISTGMVHGIWLKSSTHDSVHTENSLYPTYIPLAQNNSDGSVIAVSRSSIIDVIADDISKEFSNGEFEVVEVSIAKPVFDSYVFVSRPDTFVVDAEIRVYARRTVDINMLKEHCYYKSIVPSTSELSSCLLEVGGIARAQLNIHPWFALRTPIARAIDIRIVE
jgi:hypothetical protein